jgi:hypothetical protein
MTIPWWGLPMKLSLTGIKNPSIWARTHFGTRDLAYRLAVERTSSQARRNRISLSILQLLEPEHEPSVYRVGLSQLQRAGGHHVLPRDGS